MFKFMTLCAVAAFAAMMTGCCGGPIGWTTGAGSHCHYCEGAPSQPVIHRGPVARLMTAHQRTVCGSGCGEVYYGEWLSNPPDCCDPCDNAQQCTPPICPQPGFFFRLFRGFYGVRLPQDECCEDGYYTDDCGSCGDCDSCGDGEIIHEGHGGSPGCSSCAASTQGHIPFDTKPVHRSPYTRGGQPTSVSRSRVMRR